MTTCDIKLASVVNQAMLHVNSITYIIVIKTKTLTDHGNHPSVPCRNIHADSVHSVVLQCGPRMTNRHQSGGHKALDRRRPHCYHGTDMACMNSRAPLGCHSNQLHS